MKKSKFLTVVAGDLFALYTIAFATSDNWWLILLAVGLACAIVVFTTLMTLAWRPAARPRLAIVFTVTIAIGLLTGQWVGSIIVCIIAVITQVIAREQQREEDLWGK